jgi:hypothetical protein
MRIFLDANVLFSAARRRVRCANCLRRSPPGMCANAMWRRGARRGIEAKAPAGERR